MKPRNVWVAWALAALALMATTLIPTAAFAATRSDETSSSSASSEDGGDSSGNARTVPHWSSSFTDPTNHVTYPFTMVGSDPRLGRSTKVKTEIVPLKFKFVAGSQNVSLHSPTPQAATMDGRANVADTEASPIFTPANFNISGDDGVQYGDAFMRAQFGKVGTGYHVVLGKPKVAKTVSISVPESKGVAVLNPAGVLIGLVDSTWFRERLANLIHKLEIKPSTLPIFLTNNVFLYENNDLHQLTLGGHGAGSPASNAPVTLTGHKAVRTFVFAAYIAPNTFLGLPPPIAGLSDINVLSHEIAEWMDNPFGSNKVQPYQIPVAPPGVCSADLETGDPLRGVSFHMPGNPNDAAGFWHPQDGLFLNWFARDGEAPGLAPAHGRYTYMGPLTIAIGGPYAAFADPAEACP